MLCYFYAIINAKEVCHELLLEMRVAQGTLVFNQKSLEGVKPSQKCGGAPAKGLSMCLLHLRQKGKQGMLKGQKCALLAM